MPQIVTTGSTKQIVVSNASGSGTSGVSPSVSGSAGSVVHLVKTSTGLVRPIKFFSTGTVGQQQHISVSPKNISVHTPQGSTFTISFLGKFGVTDKK